MDVTLLARIIRAFEDRAEAARELFIESRKAGNVDWGYRSAELAYRKAIEVVRLEAAK